MQLNEEKKTAVLKIIVEQPGGEKLTRNFFFATQHTALN